MADTAFEGWAIMELMGHRKLAGYVREQEVAGSGFLRIDVPGGTAGQPEDDVATQFYAPGALYCLTPTTEDVARRFAAGCQPEPVTRWELPPAKSAEGGGDPEDETEAGV
jgi:hypothetical protein